MTENGLTNLNADGTFAPGNSYGGARAGAGRGPALSTDEQRLIQEITDLVTAGGRFTLAEDGPVAYSYQRLVDLMDSGNEAIALAACRRIHDRVFGKPRQSMEVRRDDRILRHVLFTGPEELAALRASIPRPENGEEG